MKHTSFSERGSPPPPHRIGIQPDKWGHHAWATMHATAYGYPSIPTTTERAHADHFFASIGAMLPCATCRHHYAEILRDHPPDTRSRASLMQWVFSTHNKVNAKLGRPLMSPNSFYLDPLRALRPAEKDESERARRRCLLFAMAACIPIFILHAHYE